jgi:hypothetical protein
MSAGSLADPAVFSTKTFLFPIPKKPTKKLSEAMGD